MSKNPKTIFRKEKWGPWSYDSEAYQVVGRFPAPGRHPRTYDVFLSQCRNSAEILDWIAQFAGKTWTTPEQVGHLVIALNDLIGFQRHVCGGGQDKTIEPQSVVKKRKSSWARQ